MKNLHYGHCFIGVAVAVVLLVALGVKASTVGFLAVVLACPLMMFVMMKMMMSSQAESSHHDDRPVDQGQER
jgi:choline-glycine betaine transporter